MPWHLSKSDPRKVYDERHGVVSICQTPEQAALIVNAVNAHRSAQPTEPPIKLREAPTGPLNTFEPDKCCGKRLSKALLAGEPGDSWVCPECGTTWQPHMHGVVRHWEPIPAIEVFR